MFKFGLKEQIAVLAIIPIVAIVFLSSQQILSQYNIVSKMAKLGAQVSLEEKISVFIHELQKERGASAGHLASKGARFKKVLTRQRKMTDSKSAIYKIATHEKLKLMIESLKNTRKQIDTFNISAKKAFTYYSRLIDNLHKINQAFATSNIKLIKIINSYKFFTMYKEYAGQERALLNEVFSRDMLKIEEYKVLSRIESG